MTSLGAWASTSGSATSCFTSAQGYGGSCFPKDMLVLVWTAKDHGTDVGIDSKVFRCKNSCKQSMADCTIASAGGNIAGKTVAVLGLSYHSIGRE